MAIEKDYLTTYGWTAKNAYFKIDDIGLVPNMNNLAEMIVFIYFNESSRINNPDKTLARTRIKFEINVDNFDVDKSENENLKIQGYNFLKNSTNGFRKNSMDV